VIKNELITMGYLNKIKNSTRCQNDFLLVFLLFLINSFFYTIINSFLITMTYYFINIL